MMMIMVIMTKCILNRSMCDHVSILSMFIGLIAGAAAVLILMPLVVHSIIFSHL